MQRFATPRAILAVSGAGLMALLASCAAPPPPPRPVAPPPPKVVRIPPRPQPPMGAPANYVVPPRQADGKRMTVNSGLSSAQTVWNLRSAFNVAALNCLNPQHADILPGYAAFLKNHARSLKSANRDLDRTFRANHGSKYIKERERYQTRIYNFFAYPPVLPAFCDASRALALELKQVAPGQLDAFAPAALAKLDAVYQQFYTSFDQYKSDLAAWELHYGSGTVVAAGSSSSQSLAW